MSDSLDATESRATLLETLANQGSEVHSDSYAQAADDSAQDVVPMAAALRAIEALSTQLDAEGQTLMAARIRKAARL